MRKLMLSFVAANAWLACATAQEGPGLGVPATPEQVAGWDISIGPDGAGLPPGSGTAAAGKTVYEGKCLACHGAEGAGRPNDVLLAICDDGVRLHSPCDAVRHAAFADAR